MALNFTRELTKNICIAVVLTGINACSSTEDQEKPGTLEATQETMQFVESYYAGRSSNSDVAARGVPLQMSARIGPSTDADVCQTGELYGPFTVTDGSLEGETSASANQPTLRLANQGALSVCMIITSPVNASLDLEADALYVDTTDCEQAPAYLGGVWEGDYSCTSECGNDSGFVSLTLLQDDYSATYTDSSASYEGTVCGNKFEFSGGGSGYNESGTFTLNSDGTASKTSSYQNTNNECGGTCSDPMLTRVYSNALVDDFADGSLDPLWILSAVNTNSDVDGWTYTESDSSLAVSGVSPQTVHSGNGMEYSILTLSRDLFTGLADFLVEVSITWESADDSAMQYFNLQLFPDDTSPRIAYAGYSDAWVASSGQKSAGISTTPFASGIGTLPNTGSASIKILRQASLVSIFWNGDKIHEDTSNPANLGEVQLNFGHYPFDDGLGAVSSFGTISIDSVRVSGRTTP